MSRALLEILRRRYRVSALDYSKASFEQGNFDLSRLLRVVRLVVSSFNRSGRSNVTYLTLSQSLLGNLRDLLFIAVNRSPKIVIHLHGGGIGRLLFERLPFVRFMNRLICRRVAKAIVLGESLRGNYREVVRESKIVVIPNFVDGPLASDEALTAKHGESIIEVTFLSNLIEGKGHDELLDAFLSLDVDERARMHLTFAGTFETAAQEKAFRERIARCPAVRYEGTVGGLQKERLLTKSHVFCLPTYYRYEGQPVSLLEAYGHGCIAVTTPHGGIVDVFADGENGLFVTPRSSASIAAALRAIAAMGVEQRMQIALKNIKRARTEFSRGRFERDIYRLFEELMK